METYQLEKDGVDNVVFCLQCLHANLTVIYNTSQLESLFCATDYLSHIIDELSFYLEKGG